MPDRATVEAATPKCPIIMDVTTAGKKLEIACCKLMSYDPEKQMWRCSLHGHTMTPNTLIRRQQATA